MKLFQRKTQKPTIEPSPVSLADEAVSAVGFHDAQRAKGIARMEELDRRLEANIRREMAALSDLRAELARERAAEGISSDAHAAAALEAASDDIDAAMAEIELNMRDETASAIERSLKDHRNSIRPLPKRSRKVLEAVN